MISMKITDIDSKGKSGQGTEHAITVDINVTLGEFKVGLIDILTGEGRKQFADHFNKQLSSTVIQEELRIAFDKEYEKFANYIAKQIKYD